MTLNRMSGLVVAAVGAILLFWIIPHHTELVGDTWLEPTTLPRATSITIMICGLLHFVFPTGKAEFDLAFTGRVTLFLIISIIGLYLMQVVGFLIAAPILVLVLMVLIGERRPLWLISGIILLPASIWFCVDFLLDRPLP